MTLESLALESLAEGVPIFFDGGHVASMQKCIFSLDSQGHESGVILSVEFKERGECQCRLTWAECDMERIRAAHADEVESVEDSAKAIAVLILRTYTPYKVQRQAQRGTHVDYYLCAEGDELPFQNMASLEASGILCAGESGIRQRVKEKRERLDLKKVPIPVYIVVVEHSYPTAWIEKVTS